MKMFLIGLLALIIVGDGRAHAAPPQILEATAEFEGFDPLYDNGTGIYIWRVSGVATDDPLGPGARANITSPIGGGGGTIDAIGTFSFRVGIRPVNLPPGDFTLPLRSVDIQTREVSGAIDLFFASPNNIAVPPMP